MFFFYSISEIGIIKEKKMPAHLPPNLLALFAPRPPLEFIKPYDKLPCDKPRTGKYRYDGVASFLEKFEKAEDQPLPIREETREERRARLRESKLEEHKRGMQDELLEWDPNKNKESTVNPYKTLFVGRLDFNTTENRIKKEFENFGRIMEVKLVCDRMTGKSKGYAFVEFESERDMRYAFKIADRIRIDGRTPLVDVERGRTVSGWRPRRFGGGLGETRKTVKKGYKAPKQEAQVLSLYDHVEDENSYKKLANDESQRDQSLPFDSRDNKDRPKRYHHNHRFNHYDDMDRGGGSFTKNKGVRDNNETNPQNDRDRRGPYKPRQKPERTGLQYTRGGFDFGDGGFFGSNAEPERFDSRGKDWKGNKETLGDRNKNPDEAMGGMSRYDERYERKFNRRDARIKEEEQFGAPKGFKREAPPDSRNPMGGKVGGSEETQPKKRRDDRDYTIDNDGWGGGTRGGGGRYNVGRIAKFGTRDLDMTPKYKTYDQIRGMTSENKIFGVKVSNVPYEINSKKPKNYSF